MCGLDVNYVKFAVSPPYFDLGADVDRTEKSFFSLLRGDFMVGGDHHVCVSVYCILYFCFAYLT